MVEVTSMNAASTTTGSEAPFTVETGLAAGLSFAWHRSIRLAWRAACALVAFFVIAYAALVTSRHLGAERAFDDPRAYIDGANCNVSPDGRTAYVYLQHPHWFGIRDAVWAIDVETGERERLPRASPTLDPWLPGDTPHIASALSWDGRAMYGAHQLGDMHDFFATDLESGDVVAVEFAEFDAEVNHAGWRFERVGSIHDELGPAVRASRSEGDVEGVLELPTRRRPAVAREDPFTLYFIDHEGKLHALDARTGEDRILPLDDVRDAWLSVSPDGRWLAVRRNGADARLLDVESGRFRTVPDVSHEIGPGDWPIVTHPGGRGTRWTLGNIDGDRPVTLDVPVGSLRHATPHLLLGIDAKNEAAYLFSLDGRRVVTLRAGRAS